MFSFTGIMNLTTLIDQAQEYLNSSKCENLVVSISYYSSSFNCYSVSKLNKIQILKIILLWVFNLSKLVLIKRKDFMFRTEQKGSDPTWHSASPFTLELVSSVSAAMSSSLLESTPEPGSAPMSTWPWQTPRELFILSDLPY